jgi:hypothetical protein
LICCRITEVVKYRVDTSCTIFTYAADASDPAIGGTMTDVAPASPDVTPGAALAKAALYLRVSTGRQAESDLSIPTPSRASSAISLSSTFAN